MKKLLSLALLFSLFAVPAFAKVEVKDGKFWFNGERQEMVWGRSCFKLGNQVTYQYTGQGGQHWGLHSARAFIDEQLSIFGNIEHPVCRVLLESDGWRNCDTNNDGKPQSCMFGSEPQDQGAWNREALRDGVRETQVHPVEAKTIEWFFAISQETGMAFELVIDGTLKHDNIPAGEIDHVIRQVGVLMGELSLRYPQALIIPNLRNEWNAHNESGHTLDDINMWAVRWDRDNYWDGAAKIIDPGGGNTFTYDVGPEDGKYRAGMIHPDRGDEWWQFPNNQQLARLRTDARGMPIGYTESMYFRERCAENLNNGAGNNSWYGPGGWTKDFDLYKQFLNHQFGRIDYMIIHDQKGVQSTTGWPCEVTLVDKWIMDTFNGGTGGGPPPPPPPPVLEMIYYDRLIHHGYNAVFGRNAGQPGLDTYNPWFRECYADKNRECMTPFLDVLARSTEYANNNTH